MDCIFLKIFNVIFTIAIDLLKNEEMNKRIRVNVCQYLWGDSEPGQGEQSQSNDGNPTRGVGHHEQRHPEGHGGVCTTSLPGDGQLGGACRHKHPQVASGNHAERHQVQDCNGQTLVYEGRYTYTSMGQSLVATVYKL